MGGSCQDECQPNRVLVIGIMSNEQCRDTSERTVDEYW